VATPMLATLVDVDVLLKIVGAAFGAGIGVSLVFSLVIYGGTRFVDLRRQGNQVGATFFAVTAIVWAAVFVAAVVLGLTIMTQKS
jgi:hypothetical protein